MPDANRVLEGLRRCDLRQHAGRDDDFLERLLGGVSFREQPEERRTAEVREGAPDIRLEEHNRRKHYVAEGVANDPVHGLEVCRLRQEQQAHHQPGASNHLRRAGPSDELHHLVDQDRHDRNVEDVPPPDRAAPRTTPA